MTTTQPALGSMQYDLANNLKPGTSSSYELNQNTGAITVPQQSTTSPTINAGIVGQSTSMTMPNVPPNTTAQGIISSSVQGATNSQQQIQQAQQNVKDIQLAQGPSQADQAQQNVMNAARNALGMENQINTNQANAEAAQVNPQQNYLNNINNEIAKENASYLGSQHQVYNSFTTAGQASAANTAIATEHAYRIAPLAIMQAAAQQNIQAIQANFDRQTKLMIQPYENELKFQQTFAQKYADSLTAKESKQLDLVMQERKDIIQQTKELQQAKANMIAEISKNGGGTDAATIKSVQDATDITSIANAGSKYIGKMDYLKSQADIAKSKADTAQSYAQISKLKAETQKIIAENDTKTAPATKALARAQSQANISVIDNLLSSGSLKSAVGPNPLARVSFSEPFTANRANAIAAVGQITSQLTLDKLVQAKQNGATFGSLTEGERQALANAATKISSWEVKDSTGKVIGYSTTEKEFNKELDKIGALAKYDYVLKGGSPTDAGIIIDDKGNMFVKNSDGSVTQLN